MKETVNLQIKMISWLLHYPDKSLLGLLPAFKEVLEALEDTSVQDDYEPILAYFEQRSLIQLQEQYTETFDLKPSNCLDLTYHHWGDSDKRGPALAHLEEIFQEAGFERVNSELPDYLPLVLEFISEQPDAASAEIITLYGSTVKLLSERLQQAGGPYAALLKKLVDILGLAKVTVDSQAATIR